MRGRLWLFVLLASALTFLVSLFLPWSETTAPRLPEGFANGDGLVNLLARGQIEGWLAVAGDVAVLVVVAIVLATIAALRRPQLAASLPIGGLGVALGYFAIAVAIEVQTLGRLFVGGYTGHRPTIHRSWTYGFYLGLACGGIALLSGLAYRRNELLRSRDSADLLAAGLGIALLVAFLLPWAGRSETATAHGIEIPPASIAALGLILAAGWLHREAGRRWRLPYAVATAVLTGGAASAVAHFGAQRLYGTWIGVGCAVVLVGVEAVRASPLQVPALPRGPAAARMGGAVLLIVALFLPWQQLGPVNEGLNGWYSAPGAAAGVLCLLLLATQAVPAAETYVLGAVAAIVIFVAALATAFREEPHFSRLGYGGYVGIVATGILVAGVFVPLRPGHVDRARARARLVPLAASVLCVAAVAVPSWFVLPNGWEYQAAPLYGWFAVPGVLLAIYLVHLWARQVRGPASAVGRLTLVPLVLLTLPALELIRFRRGDVIWGAVILVGLCLLLALCGWFEEGYGVPEGIWRVDRLPETES